jgi:hypothetical protein
VLRRPTATCRLSVSTILRHGAATLVLAGGTHLKVVSEMLGHSSIGITADTYTSVLPEVARAAAGVQRDRACAAIPPRSFAPTRDRQEFERKMWGQGWARRS